MDINQVTEKVKQALTSVQEPDLGDSFTGLNLVEVHPAEGEKVLVRIGIHNPAMHSRKKVEELCRAAISQVLDEGSFTLEAVPLPPENKRPPYLRTLLKGVKHVIAIASGKGGVGKSTVTANLAVALQKRGFSTGIVDADIYGPSMPIMFGVENARPQMVQDGAVQKMLPVEAQGIKMLSIGFFADMTQPVVWRGPMAVKALRQLFTDAAWGELDFLLVDLPPGTGDIHMSLVQEFPLTGAVVVSTPQQVALADASRAVAMFRLPAVNVPVLGMVENMAYFTPEELPDNRYYIFGKGGARKMAEDARVPFLGEVPLVQGIREAGDEGVPAVSGNNGPASIAFEEIAANVLRIVKSRQAQGV